MVKSKKLSRGSLAVLLLALVLSLSMVVGITGAWFTDKFNANNDHPLELGTVSISALDGTGGTVHYASTMNDSAVNLLVDRDTFEINYGIQNDSTVDIYYAITGLGIKVYEAQLNNNETAEDASDDYWERKLVSDNPVELATYEGYFYVMTAVETPAEADFNAGNYWVKDGTHYFKEAKDGVATYSGSASYFTRAAYSTFADNGDAHLLKNGANVANTQVYIMFDSAGAANSAYAAAKDAVILELTIEVGAVQAAHVANATQAKTLIASAANAA